MPYGYADNDGTWPDETEVEVRFPTSDGQARSDWPWLPGTVLGQCGPGEWHVLIDDYTFATHTPPASNADKMMRCGITDDEGRVLCWLPMVFRNASEIRTPTNAPQPGEK